MKPVGTTTLVMSQDVTNPQEAFAPEVLFVHVGDAPPPAAGFPAPISVIDPAHANAGVSASQSARNILSMATSELLIGHRNKAGHRCVRGHTDSLTGGDNDNRARASPDRYARLRSQGIWAFKRVRSGAAVRARAVL